MKLLKAIVAGLGLAAAAGGGITWSVLGKLKPPAAIPLLVGGVFLLASLYWNFAGFRSFLGKKSTRYGLNVAVLIVIVLGIISLVEAISTKYYRRWDLTEGRRYSLSLPSKKFLATLKVPVKVTAFYRMDQEGRSSLEELLKQYRNIYSGLEFELVDPDRNPGEAKKYQVTSYGTIVVESGDKQEKIFDSSEQAITNAILKVSRAGKKTIYFLTGHGELSPTNEQRQGYSTAKKVMEEVNYQVKELVLMKEEVPADATALVISGPKQDPLDQELEAIKRYVDRGGNILFLLEPFATPKLAALLKPYGLILKEDIVLDRMSRLFGGDYFIPVITNYKDHEITRDFNLATFFPTARSVGIESKPPAGVTAKELATTGPDSWAETNRKLLEQGKARYDEGEDSKGPITIAAVSTVPIKEEGKKGQARLVLFGDADFASNAYIGLSGNGALFLSAMRWLAEEEELITVRPRQQEFSPLFLTRIQGNLVFWLPVIVLPGLVVVVGAVILTRRRRQG